MRILLATCEEYPDLGVSARVYREALCRAGATAEAVVWTRGVRPFIGADLVVIRATWDYHRNLDGYRAWLRGLDGTRRHVEVTAFPLVGQAGRFLGAVALFWEKVPA